MKPLAACVALCCVVSCAGLKNRATQPNLRPWPELQQDFRVETLRTRLYEYSVTFASEVELAASSIERRTTDATIRRNALLWKARAIPEMRKACFRLGPASGLVDAWVFARQMHQLYSPGGAGATAFGPFQADAVEVSRRLEDEIRRIGESIAVSPEARAEFERKVIDPWLASHPLRDVTFARESSVARFAEQSRDLGALAQSVGTIEELAIAIAQQARIYLADLPRQIQGEVELVRSDILSSEGVTSMQGDLHTTAVALDGLSAALGRIATTAETVPPLAENERRIVLEDVNRQRALVMAAITSERELAIEAIVQALASERAALLREIDAQRVATLEWASAERRSASSQVRRQIDAATDLLRAERAVVMVDLTRMLDTVMIRLAIFVLAGVVLAPIVAHVYVRVWPKRRS